MSSLRQSTNMEASVAAIITGFYKFLARFSGERGSTCWRFYLCFDFGFSILDLVIGGGEITNIGDGFLCI